MTPANLGRGDVIARNTRPNRVAAAALGECVGIAIHDSGVVGAIRLMKLWRVQHGISMSSFIMDLLVIDLLKGKKAWGLDDQLEHVLKELRDKAPDLKVEDPANPHGNDLNPKLDQHRSTLEWTARSTLNLVQNSGWEAVFGKVQEDTSAKVASLRRIAAAVAVPSRPYGYGNG